MPWLPHPKAYGGNVVVNPDQFSPWRQALHFLQGKREIYHDHPLWQAQFDPKGVDRHSSSRWRRPLHGMLAAPLRPKRGHQRHYGAGIRARLEKVAFTCHSKKIRVNSGVVNSTRHHCDQWDRGEHQEENHQTQDGNCLARHIQRRDLVEWLGVQAAQQENQERPQPPSYPDKP